MRYYRTFLHLILILPLILSGTLAFANFDLYSNRPDIKKLKARKSTSQQERWNKINTAQLEFLAQLFGLYPTQTIYFIARDGEYLYDLAKILEVFIPEIRNRVHLINVSRDNMNDPLLKDYLIQQGITEKRISRNGVVFVDSGFYGSIPFHIKSFYSSKFQSDMYIHLAFSNNPNVPGSRAFKTESQITGTIYEDMARHFRRSTGYKYVGNKIVPVSPSVTERKMNEDGIIDRKEAFEYSQDLLFFGTRKENIIRFKQRLAQWKFLCDLAEGENSSLKNIFNILEKITKTWTHPRSEAIVADFIEFHKIYFQNSISLAGVKPELGVGLTFNISSMLSPIIDSSNINLIIKNMTESDLNDLAFLTLKIKERGQFSDLNVMNRIWSQMSAQQFNTYFNSILNYSNQKNYETVVKIISTSLKSENLNEFSIGLNLFENKRLKLNSTCKKAVGK